MGNFFKIHRPEYQKRLFPLRTYLFKSLFFLLFLLLHSSLIQANVAQPGIYGAGGTGFTMLFPEEHSSFKKVQMVKERIYVQLYKHFAVVKGVYLMKNTSPEHLSFKMGYPIKGIYKGGYGGMANTVFMDSLSQFKVKSEDRWLPLLDIKKTSAENDWVKSYVDQWKIWEISFLPNQSRLITVYFLVNTGSAFLRSGYTEKSQASFIYLLESGSMWRQPIEKGNFYIQLCEGLQLDSLYGLSDGFDFRYSSQKKILKGFKANFTSNPSDNLIVTWPHNDAGIPFTQAVANSTVYFERIDLFSQLPFAQYAYSPAEIKDPYYVADHSSGSWFSSLKYLGLYIFVFFFIIFLFCIFN